MTAAAVGLKVENLDTRLDEMAVLVNGKRAVFFVCTIVDEDPF